MNISRGCIHGCIYCDSRSICYKMEHDFEDVEIKINAPILLEQKLKAKRKKCILQMTLTTYDENICKIIEHNVCTTKER